MAFAGLNYIAVIAAAIVGFVFGAGYYTALGKPWMAAAGLTKEDVEGPTGKPKPGPMITAAVAQLIIAYLLAGLMGHVGNLTFSGALITAFFVWLGFVMTTMTVNHRFQGRPLMLTVIDGGHWLGVLLVMAVVISLIGV